MTKTRGQQRLCSVTYSAIADWTGLALHTVRSYAGKEFDQHDLESVLRWVNGRRIADGLPMIGQPGPTDPSGNPLYHVLQTKLDIPENPPTGTLQERVEAAQGAMDRAERRVEPATIPIPKPSSGGYNALTGEYDR